MRVEYEIEFEDGGVRISSGDSVAYIPSGSRTFMPDGIRRRIFDAVFAQIANEIATGIEEQDAGNIEQKSLSIIDSIIPRDMDNPMRHIVIRAVHAAGDFSIAQLIRYSAGFFPSMVQRLGEGCTVLCDSEMVRAGIYEPRVLENNRAVCLLNDAETREMAQREGITRSAAGIRIGLRRYRDTVVVIGNAPTALQEAMRIIKEEGGYDTPVIGIPVGFVNASRVKQELISSGIDYITVIGNRGGSPIAASIVNSFGRFLR
ncbi:precorrin-8X methylmutase [Thermoplasma sp.]|uniref:precorrin-8X methylmutase n=1 Tax=Thermoplasma sp. TaxID=1973142 RepID=UPI0025ECCF7A|nr:precorrin-8X methylmutase [Thermoplasma sp.]